MKFERKPFQCQDQNKLQTVSLKALQLLLLEKNKLVQKFRKKIKLSSAYNQN